MSISISKDIDIRGNFQQQKKGNDKQKLSVHISHTRSKMLVCRQESLEDLTVVPHCVSRCQLNLLNCAIFIIPRYNFYDKTLISLKKPFVMYQLWYMVFCNGIKQFGK